MANCEPTAEEVLRHEMQMVEVQGRHVLARSEGEPALSHLDL